MLVLRLCPPGLHLARQQEAELGQHMKVKGRRWSGRGKDEEVKPEEQSKSPLLTSFCVGHPAKTPHLGTRQFQLPCQLVSALSKACLLAGHSLEHLLLPHIH